MNCAKSLFIMLLVSFSIVPETLSFSAPPHGLNSPQSRFYRISLFGNQPQGQEESTSVDDLDDELLERLRSMRIKKLKEELSALKVSTRDVLEKEELVRRLYQAKKEREKASVESSPDDVAGDGAPPSNAISVPLFFATTDAGMRVADVKSGGGLTIQSSSQPYAAFQIELEKGYKLSLLLDTACSGLVLRPSVVRAYNLPTFSNPVTMTAAGGTDSNTGLTQLQRFLVGGRSFGPLPAAVQDIGALPASLDGILGLSFLSQFSCVEMNFLKGTLTLFKGERNPPILDSFDVVAEAAMEPTSLGVWTVRVKLDGRGPVSMLVDTGAANSFLNWEGVEALGLDRNSPEIAAIPDFMGAMGADNVAMELTHRYTTKRVNLGSKPSLDGYAFIENGVPVDIGQIPVLHSMKSHNVGGILGIDVLKQAACVRLVFFSPVPRLLLLN